MVVGSVHFKKSCWWESGGRVGGRGRREIEVGGGEGGERDLGEGAGKEEGDQEGTEEERGERREREKETEGDRQKETEREGRLVCPLCPTNSNCPIKGAERGSNSSDSAPATAQVSFLKNTLLPWIGFDTPQATIRSLINLSLCLLRILPLVLYLRTPGVTVTVTQGEIFRRNQPRFGIPTSWVRISAPPGFPLLGSLWTVGLSRRGKRKDA